MRIEWANTYKPFRTVLGTCKQSVHVSYDNLYTSFLLKLTGVSFYCLQLQNHALFIQMFLSNLMGEKMYLMNFIAVFSMSLSICFFSFEFYLLWLFSLSF